MLIRPTRICYPGARKTFNYGATSARTDHSQRNRVQHRLLSPREPVIPVDATKGRWGSDFDCKHRRMAGDPGGGARIGRSSDNLTTSTNASTVNIVTYLTAVFADRITSQAKMSDKRRYHRITFEPENHPPQIWKQSGKLRTNSPRIANPNGFQYPYAGPWLRTENSELRTLLRVGSHLHSQERNSWRDGLARTPHSHSPPKWLENCTDTVK